MPYNPRIMALDLASRTPARDRYVYALYASGQLLPCYIGVGKGNRLNQHWINAKNDRFRGNLRKHRTLRACWLRGIDVRAEKIAVDLTIDQAGAIERFLIDCYGRRDLRTGCLLNASAGGFGTRNFAPSTRARLAEAGRRHMARPEIRAMLDERKATPEARSKLIEANRRRPPPSIESRRRWLKDAVAKMNVTLRATQRFLLAGDLAEIEVASNLPRQESPYRRRFANNGKTLN